MIPRPILPSPESSLAHARAQAEGAAFETLLEWTHKTYLQAGRAAIYRNGIAAKHIRTQDGDRMIAEEKSRPDFSGTMAGGISVHFEAKTLNDTCGWRLPAERMHQYYMLLAQARMGAIAFFLIEERAAGVVYLLRVHPDIPLDDSGRPGLQFAGIPLAGWQLKRKYHPEPHSLPAFYVERNPDGLYDWLTAVEDLWTRKSTLPQKDIGRPRSEVIAQRNAKIIALAKTHSAAQVAGRMGMNPYTVRSILRGRRNGKDHKEEVT